MLWLDCDREGENIAFEVVDVCRAVKQNLYIRRAHFSALIDRLVNVMFFSAHSTSNDSNGVFGV